ncbi:MAG: aspartate aminotransferase family protein [Candidatus Heimdallarchaeota archaeon]
MTSWIDKEVAVYRSKHKKSLHLWSEAKKRFPGGVSHNIRDFHMNAFNLSPPFIERAQDTNLYDVDGNVLLDYWMTHGAALLGHSHEAILKAIANQLPNSNHFGMVNELAIKLADKIIAATPSIEKLRFCTTGTEATMYASRLARAFTGKSKIAKIKGGWHGGNDTLFYYVSKVEAGMESKGIKELENSNILSFDYNDIEGAVNTIKNHKDELAAIIMEPVLGAGGAIPPKEGFLEIIREETEKNNIILIYDEIITGFRLSYNSAQGYFGVTPDLTTMGKIVGGGAPIGVIGGRDDILEQANIPSGGEVWIGGGTFSGNPVSMVAGIATLEVLEKGGTNLYDSLNNSGEDIRKQISVIIDEHNAPATVTGVGSMISIHWFKERLAQLETGSEVKLNLDSNRVALHHLLMFNQDILSRGGLGYLSIKHKKEDNQRAVKAINDSVKTITKNT